MGNLVQQKDNVLSIYEKLCQLLPGDLVSEVLDEPSLLIDLGYESLEDEDSERAYDLFMINLKIEGESAAVLNGLTVALFEMGEFRIAERVIRKAFSMYPEDSITLANLAGIEWENGLLDEAAVHYAKAIKLDSRTTETRYNLINIYAEQGNLLLAYVTCLELIEKFPEEKDAIELRDELLLNLAISMY